MSFDPAFIDELRSRLPLSGVIGRAVKLTRAGREWKACCPFHNEKSPSFYINDDKGFFHCFGCGAHGDILGFTMRYHNLSFVEALERLAGEAGMQVPRPDPRMRAREEQRRDQYAILDSAATWFQNQLNALSGRAARDYLFKRGLDGEAAEQFRLGWAPADRGALPAYLLKEGAREVDLIELGLARRPEGRPGLSCFFGARLMFPVGDRRGRVVAFGGRLIEGDGPKYLNSPETPLFHKGELLYGLSRARAAAGAGQAIIVVEGYMDVIACVRAGWAGAVAPLGTALTEAQILALWRLIPTVPRLPILCFDGDSAGERAAARALDRILPHLKADVSARFAFMPKGEDPDSLLKNSGSAGFQRVLDAAIPLDAMLWKLEAETRNLDTPEARAGLREALMERITAIADGTVQRFYKQAIFDRLSSAFPYQGNRSKTPGHRANPQKTAAATHRPRLISHDQRGALLLFILSKHPDLLHEYGESLGMIDFADSGLETLKIALLSYDSSESGVDAAMMQSHLHDSGCGAVLENLVARLTRQDGVLVRKAMLASSAAELATEQWQMMTAAELPAEISHGWRMAVSTAGPDAEPMPPVAQMQVSTILKRESRSDDDLPPQDDHQH